MLEKIPGIGKSNENDDSESENSHTDLTIEDVRENDDISPEDLPRDVKMGLLFSEAPTTLNQLRDKWRNERVELYFLLFSIIAAGGMLVLMLLDQTIYVVALFILYSVVMIPLLYIHEKERYFKHDDKLAK